MSKSWNEVVTTASAEANTVQTEEHTQRIEPSSSTSGFFQTPPRVLNQFDEDVAFRRALNLYLPSSVREAITPDLQSFGAKVLSPQILRWNQDANTNKPFLRTWDSWGRRKDELVTSEGWRRLQGVAHEEGLVTIGYERRYAQYDRLYQYFKMHLWSASAAMVTCPSAMQDGAIAVLSSFVNQRDTPPATRKVLVSALERLMSRDPSYAWTSGQWMTERPGGSDVRNTETRAAYTPDIPSTLPAIGSDGSPLGPWSIDGFKWFSSATDADMTLLLAKTGNSDDLSLFFAPTKKIVRASTDKTPKNATSEGDIEFNGIQLQRLKDKLGTHSLPTAELVLNGLRAHLLGKVGRGVAGIATVLNITRINTAVGAVAGWGRSLGVSRAFSRVRHTSGRLLTDMPAHMKSLAVQHVAYRVHVLFTFFVVSLLGYNEHAASLQPGSSALIPSQAEDVARLLRLLTPAAKSLVSLASIDGIRFCMESMGGVGYLENSEPELNIAKIYRDTNVNAIWEGTGDVLAADMVRVVKGRDGSATIDTFESWVNCAVFRWRSSKSVKGRDVLKIATAALQDLLKQMKAVASNNDVEEVIYKSRELMEIVGAIVCTVTVVEDAVSDDDRVAWKVAERWLLSKKRTGAQGAGWKEEARWDKIIVFGHEDGSGERANL